MSKDNFLLLFSAILFLLSVFSLMNTYQKIDDGITGKATAGINVTIGSVAMINLTVDNVDWGAGSLTENSTYAIIDTTGNVLNGTWDPVSSGFVISNIGNVNLTLRFSSLHDAGTFIGGSGSRYRYMLSNDQENSCAFADITYGVYYDFPVSGTPIEICEILQPSKSITLDLMLKIPDNSLIGNLSDVISLSFEQFFV